jgi:hypothetical protein
MTTFCDFDECPNDGTETRGQMTLCPQHARESDRIDRQTPPSCACCMARASTRTVYDLRVCDRCAERHADDHSGWHPLQQLLEEMGVEGLREYSGRAMYGERCLAIVGELGAIMAAIVSACLRRLDMSETAKADIEDAMGDLRVDAMGRDSVVYFPSVPWTGLARRCPDCGRSKDDHEEDCSYGDE